MEENRRYKRVDSINLLSYVSLDEDGKPLEQGMGRTLNISQGGLLIETQVPIEAKYILLMAVDIQDHLIKIKGKVAYSKEVEKKLFHTGVRFIESNEKIREIVVEMVKVFTKQRLDSRSLN